MTPVPGQVGDEDHGLVADVEGNVRQSSHRRPPLTTQDLHACYAEFNVARCNIRIWKSATFSSQIIKMCYKKTIKQINLIGSLIPSTKHKNRMQLRIVSL